MYCQTISVIRDYGVGDKETRGLLYIFGFKFTKKKIGSDNIPYTPQFLHKNDQIILLGAVKLYQLKTKIYVLIKRYRLFYELYIKKEKKIKKRDK